MRFMIIVKASGEGLQPSGKGARALLGDRDEERRESYMHSRYGSIEGPGPGGSGGPAAQGSEVKDIVARQRVQAIVLA